VYRGGIGYRPREKRERTLLQLTDLCVGAEEGKVPKNR